MDERTEEEGKKAGREKEGRGGREGRKDLLS